MVQIVHDSYMLSYNFLASGKTSKTIFFRFDEILVKISGSKKEKNLTGIIWILGRARAEIKLRQSAYHIDLILFLF